MTPAVLETSPLAAVLYASIVYAVMWAAASWMARREPARRLASGHANRVGAIDGLRGVLAVGVLVHHSFVAYVFFAQGRWGLSRSPVINQLGQTTVALFFMITGFLFAGKSMEHRVDWLGLYRGRLARLAPLYVVVIAAMFVIALASTRFELREPLARVADEAVIWLAFGVFGMPEVNGYASTGPATAGVVWSLKYEVLFYLFAVPLLWVANRTLPRRLVMIAVTASAIALLAWRRAVDEPIGDSLFALHFLGGILVAYVDRSRRGAGILRSRALAALAVLALGYVGTRLSTANAASVVCSCLIFAAVVGGASMFGLLKTKGALWLGDISYGVYLTHGLCLFVSLTALRRAGLFGSIALAGAYLPIVATIAVAVVALSSATYLWLEMPVMRRVRRRGSARTRSKVRAAVGA